MANILVYLCYNISKSFDTPSVEQHHYYEVVSLSLIDLGPIFTAQSQNKMLAINFSANKTFTLVRVIGYILFRHFSSMCHIKFTLHVNT